MTIREKPSFEEKKMGDQPNANRYGICDYDVPKSRRGVYNKLRDKLRRISLMRTWSVYLVKLEHRDRILAILEEFNKDPDEEPVRFGFLKFDDSESEKLDQWVQEEFKKSLTTTTLSKTRPLSSGTTSPRPPRRSAKRGDWPRSSA
jgi:hypothetical protein